MDKLLDLTRDFDAAKAAFEAYLDEYDRADDKIHLKIVHTYGVVDAAEDIDSSSFTLQLSSLSASRINFA